MWIKKYSYNEPYASVYYWHPAYRAYPVVGISYEQAIEFCKWRTEMVSIFMAKSKKYALIDFEYRLPSKKEWETLTYNGREEFYNNGL